jgi:Icc-related predicted phosphoesterase
MKILAFADIHGEKPAVNALFEKVKKEKPGILLNCGDFSVFQKEYKYLFEKIQEAKIPHYFIAGNHEDEAFCKKLQKEYKFSTYVGNRFLETKGPTIIGINYADDLTDNAEEQDSAAYNYLITKGERLPEGKRIVLSHYPPHSPETPKGSKLVSEVARQYNPVYLFWGHVHELQGHVVNRNQINPGKTGRIIRMKGT